METQDFFRKVYAQSCGEVKEVGRSEKQDDTTRSNRRSMPIPYCEPRIDESYFDEDASH